MRESGAMKTLTVGMLLVWAWFGAMAGDFGIASCDRAGGLTVANAFTNGVCTIERAVAVTGPWSPCMNVYTTNRDASLNVARSDAADYFRALAVDLSNGRAGFTNLTESYATLSTVAGAGGAQDMNNWRPEFEGAPATNVVLSGPHIAMADRAGNIYIADKDAHGIRKVRRDGTLITVAGTNGPGNGPDAPTAGTQVALNGPNGLWVQEDGTLYVLDTGNGKVRRLGTDGTMRTRFAVPGGIAAGRGLWVNANGSEAYVSSLTVVKRWSAADGVSDFATGFTELGNLVVDPLGRLVVTDRGAHRVYRLDGEGYRTVIAGNGATSGGGDGQRATDTALNEVRGVWFLPTGAFLVATHRGSQVWYVDVDGFIHLLLNGNRHGAHAGDGTWFYSPTEPRVSECRAVTMDYEGNVLVTENDVGYVRKIRFLRRVP